MLNRFAGGQERELFGSGRVDAEGAGLDIEGRPWAGCGQIPAALPCRSTRRTSSVGSPGGSRPEPDAPPPDSGRRTVSIDETDQLGRLAGPFAARFSSPEHDGETQRSEPGPRRAL